VKYSFENRFISPKRKSFSTASKGYPGNAVRDITWYTACSSDIIILDILGISSFLPD